MRLLEAAGYACIRAAASLGIFDVIGVGASDIVLVQCKTNAWPDAVEVEQIKMLRAPANAKKLIHKWKDRVRLPEVKEL